MTQRAELHHSAANRLTRLGVLTVAAGLALGASAVRTPAAPGAVAPSADSVSSRDPVARLQSQLAAGTVRLRHDSVLGFLPALLDALKIPASSQVLVFSRTSLQTDRITPWSPRALYFNDDVYVGYVFDSPFLEIGAVDPTRGGVFYTMPQRLGSAATGGVSLQREGRTCLMCHTSRTATGGVSGFMVLSTVADRHGYPVTGVHEGSTTDATPYAQRYGGWYVTGTGGHAANTYSPLLFQDISDKDSYRAKFLADITARRNDGAAALSGGAVQSLGERFDTTGYLTGQSDVVALSVLTHQTILHNLITATHEAARQALLQEAITPGGGDTVFSDHPALRGAVENLVRGLLFVKAAPLPAPMRGSTSFAQDFVRHGPRDTKGRSLRDLDLETRLFRYPCSFLIHSEAFTALPLVARRAVYARLWEILNGQDNTPDLQDLPAADRQAVTEILEATIPEFVTLRSAQRSAQRSARPQG